MMNQEAIDYFDAVLERRILESTISEILEQAKIAGATACAVGVSKVLGLSTSVRNQELETLEFNQDYGFGITVFVGHKKGHASTSDTSSNSIKRTVEAAVIIARQTGEDPCAGLANADLMADTVMDLDLDHPMGLSVDQAQSRAILTEQAMLKSDVTSDGVTFASHRSVHAYGNSHGFVASFTSSRHICSAVAIAKKDQQMQRDYAYTIARRGDDLESGESIGSKAAEKSLRRLGSKTIKTGHYPVLMIPEIASGFIGHIMSALRGGKLYRKASFLLDQLGEPLLPDFVHIYERPFLKRALGSRCYDSEGVATRDQHFVNAGVLESYVLDSYSGRRLNMATTANAGGVHNLHLSDTGQSQEELISMMGSGLLVTEVMGQGINLVTGDYSRGASGFWIENGEIKHPVEGITIAGNLKNMMLDIQAIGKDRPAYLSTKVGSVLFKKMMVAAN